jgi:hypothetical protein
LQYTKYIGRLFLVMFFLEMVMDVDFERVKVVVFPDGRLDTENAARYLGLSPKTLAMMRTAGSGPKFVKRGRVFYYLEDLQPGSPNSRAFTVRLRRVSGPCPHSRRQLLVV